MNSNRIDTALKAALIAATTDTDLQQKGWCLFQEKVLSMGVNLAIVATLSEIAPGPGMEAGLNAFRNKMEHMEIVPVATRAPVPVVTRTPATIATQTPDQNSTPEDKLPIVRILKWGALIAMIVGFVTYIIVTSITPSATTKPTPTPTAAAKPTTAAASVVQAVLTENGWPKNQYVLGDNTIPSKDVSTSGEDTFSKTNVKSPSEMVKFLVSSEPAAKKPLDQAQLQTGATESDVLTERNWVAVQPGVPFIYLGNTGYKNGVIVDAGEKKGGVNDIFLVFVNPTNSKVFVVRGACSNPQQVIPRPQPTPTSTPESKTTPKSTPTPTPSVTPTPTLVPKSSNRADYKQPSNDAKTDSGTGLKPVIPAVIVPAETTPPPVVKLKVGDSGVVDTAIKKPGSEAGVKAPGAGATTAAPTIAVPTTRPTPESGVNPADGGVNQGDLVNPF